MKMLFPEYNQSYELFSQRNPQSLGEKILVFPLIRILVAVIWVFLPLAAIQWLGARFIPDNFNFKGEEIVEAIISVLSFLAMIGMYRLYTRYIEQRPALEVSARNALGEAVWGMLWGAGIMCAVVGLMYVLGTYRVLGFNSPTILWSACSFFWVAAFAEEMILRVIAFKIFEEWGGSTAAIIFSALLFGFLHAGNDNATLYSSIAIAVEAGILLAATYMFTRRVWLSQGLHFAWNYVQSAVFGLAVSGNDLEGWIVPQVSGNEWITGGSFGPECSIFALILCTSAGVYFLYRAYQRGQWISPNWRLLPRTLPSS